MRESVAVAAILLLTPGIWAFDPHVDPGTVPGSCNACHEGHGASGSPMLPRPQAEVCLECHGSKAAAERMIQRGILAPNARPQSLSSVLVQPFSHPIDGRAFSRLEPGAVTCTSCHSPHRGSAEMRGKKGFTGTPKTSPRNPMQSEFEMCGRCHESTGPSVKGPGARRGSMNWVGRSYHPVEAPTNESSPSVLSFLAGHEVNCTDCHGNGGPEGPRGPHGSPNRYILREAYTVTDGQEESETTYALCYRCHDRARVLDSPMFPQHRLHVVGTRASCATCHSAHGSMENRALIRLGDDYQVAPLAPSTRTGRLGFESDAQGTGECYVTCHGYDHAPSVYGVMSLSPGRKAAKSSTRVGRPDSSSGGKRKPLRE